ncbi:hypothetical protein LSH36_446g01025 [Paralvinella palmiformis]|uniref:Uncharacterized protein n=1 Tax=Paralvinella palmiformis TaxID=53620 RepID=A0AAD9JBT6_9ANNE|nr:hypothetical protein LSH36_446g01025 [Paralvinella palmiformis]
MTTINIGDAGPVDEQRSTHSRVYALPLNTTSAINIQLFSPLQQQHPAVPSNVPLAPSASTYVGGNVSSQLSPSTPEVYSVVINTDDDTVKPNVYLTNSATESLHVPEDPVTIISHPEETKPAEDQQVGDNHNTTVVNVCADAQTNTEELSSTTVQKTAAVQSTTAVQKATAIQVNGADDSEREVDRNKTIVNVCADPQTDPEEPLSKSPVRNSTAVQWNGDENLVSISPGERDVRRSVGSETGSTGSSILDDSASVISSGSQGLSASLTDGLTSLNIDTSTGEDVVAHPHQRDFIYGRLPSQTESIDSQPAASDVPKVPVSAMKKTKQPKVTKKKIPLSWDDDAGGSDSSDIQVMDASAFILDEFTEEETRTVNDADSMKGTRVALYKGETLTAMLKVKCSTDEMGNDLRVLMLLREILARCDQLGHKMKGSAVRLTPFHLNKMKLDDGRHSKERATNVARQLGGELVLCEAVCQKHAERLHIACQIKDSVYERGPFSVGKLGILTTLWKKHKYSVAAEFAGPLCDHICFYRPHLLGSTSESALKRKRKATDTVRHLFQSRELLSQMFKTDPTITIAEAARRSFVEIIFYALYE